MNYTISDKAFYYILKHDANKQILTHKYENGYCFKRIIKLDELFKQYSITFILPDFNSEPEKSSIPQKFETQFDFRNQRFHEVFDFSDDYDEILDLHFHIRSLKRYVSYLNEQIVEVENENWFKKYRNTWLSNYDYKLYKNNIKHYEYLIDTYNIMRDELDDTMLNYNDRLCELINPLIIQKLKLEDSEKIQQKENEDSKIIIKKCKYTLHVPETSESSELKILKYTHIVDFVRNKITTIDQYGNVNCSDK